MGTVFLKLSMWQLQARSPLLKTGMKCMGTLNSYNEHLREETHFTVYTTCT